MPIELVIPSNHPILCHPLLLLPSVFPSIRVFSNESVLCIRRTNYWSFTFNISPSNDYSGLMNMVQLTSVTQLCLTLCYPKNHSTPGLPVHHQLLEFIQTHVHRVGDTIQPPHPLSSPSPPAPNPSQPQGLSQWDNTSHEMDKVLEFQLQHQSFQWTPRTNLL